MPAGDGTGPLGQGAQTGRGVGFCSGNSAPEYQNSRRNFDGRGLRSFGGRGQGRGRFFRGFQGNVNGVDNFVSENQKFDEAESLKNQSQILTQRLEEINRRIENLEKE